MISSLARKYARALLEVASEDKAEDRYGQQLEAFDNLLKEHAELKQTLENPVLPFPSKRGIIEALGAKIPLSKSVQNFILVVASNARMHQFSDFVEAYSQAWDEKRGIQPGTVYSARPLAKAQQQRVLQGMQELTRGKVRLDFKEDQDLIGGVKVRLGSTIFDGSIRARLNELESKLASQ